MARMLTAFVAAGVLGAASSAFATEPIHKTTGRIKSVDLMKHVVTLENGSTYKLERGVDIKGVRVGERITLTYSGFGGTIEASAIAPAVD